jgi:cold shock CspA family protein
MNPSNEETPQGQRSCGRVKWFNNRAGYGFVTVTSDDKNGQDVFVHHSALKVENDDQYRYLVQGEYVEFHWKQTSSEKHEWQADNVSGVNGGKLMCETRYELRNERNNYKNERPEDNSNPQNESSPQGHRFRGSGPREGEEWMIVRRSKNSGGRGGGDGNRRGYWKGNNKNWKSGNPDHQHEKSDDE